uniref:Uncharacterized protein n=1 Tax=Rhizophora mucronata TaxID=61149 RepID=A0A2P2JZ17_RHIMU
MPCISKIATKKEKRKKNEINRKKYLFKFIERLKKFEYVKYVKLDGTPIETTSDNRKELSFYYKDHNKTLMDQESKYKGHNCIGNKQMIKSS